MQVAQEVYNEVAMLGLTLKTPLAHGILEAPIQDDHIYRLEVTMWFPQVNGCKGLAAAATPVSLLGFSFTWRLHACMYVCLCDYVTCVCSRWLDQALSCLYCLQYMTLNR